MKARPIRPPRRAQLGQSMVEYAVLCVVLCAALFTPVPGSNPSMTAGQMLADAMRQMYKALSFFLSLP